VREPFTPWPPAGHAERALLDRGPSIAMAPRGRAPRPARWWPRAH